MGCARSHAISPEQDREAKRAAFKQSNQGTQKRKKSISTGSSPSTLEAQDMHREHRKSVGSPSLIPSVAPDVSEENEQNKSVRPLTPSSKRRSKLVKLSRATSLSSLPPPGNDEVHPSVPSLTKSLTMDHLSLRADDLASRGFGGRKKKALVSGKEESYTVIPNSEHEFQKPERKQGRGSNLNKLVKRGEKIEL